MKQNGRVNISYFRIKVRTQFVRYTYQASSIVCAIVLRSVILIRRSVVLGRGKNVLLLLICRFDIQNIIGGHDEVLNLLLMVMGFSSLVLTEKQVHVGSCTTSSPRAWMVPRPE